MRILYDGILFFHHPIGGASRYYENIITHLGSDVQRHLYLLDDYPITQSEQIKVHKYQRLGFRPGKLSYALEPYYFKALNALIKPDIYHTSLYESITREPLECMRIKKIVTILDMIQEKYADIMPQATAQIERKRKAIESADAIICISESTRNDLIEHYPHVANRAVVTLLASSWAQSSPVESSPSQPYFLFVAGRKYYKNFAYALKGFSIHAQSYPETQLIVTGSPFSPEEQTVIEQYKLSDRVVAHSNVNDSRLQELYQNACALIYPSEYEGFGIPILEAMLSATPVIAVKAASIPEVAGDAAYYVPPRDEEAIAAAMNDLYAHRSVRMDYIKRGTIQAGNFSWEKTAQETQSIYSQLIH